MKNPNGYGSIFKLSGKRRKPFCVRVACKYTFDGNKAVEHRPVLGYYATRSEALQALAEYNKTPYDISNKSTFADIYALWYAEKSKSVGINAKNSYNIAFDKCAELHNMQICDLRLNNYQSVIDKYAAQSQSSVKSLLQVLRSVSKYALQHELISKDYTEFLHTQYAAPRNIHKVFTENEIAALWAAQSDLIRDITLILLYSGFRVRELLEMPADNIDLENMTFTGGSKTAAGKNRIVPIHSRILPIVKQYANGFDIEYINYYRLLQKTGHTPHDTRHTFISRLQTANANHICIERLVGHSSTNITDKVYTHKDISELRQTIELLL